MKALFATTNINNFIIVSALVLSWTLLFWVNFYAELSIAMHFIAIPTLFIITGGYAAYQLERQPI